VRLALKESRIIEAALFSAGAPIAIEELKEITEIPEKIIRDVLNVLIEDYKGRETALEIAKVGDKYAMQLRTEYADHVSKFAPMEIPTKVLKTAALIAYHQPILQRDLLEMIGYRVYDHVKLLNELGLIRRRDVGRTKSLTTTERFSEYFGIASTDRTEIKKWLIEKLNMKLQGDGKEAVIIDEGEDKTEKNDEGTSKNDEMEVETNKPEDSEVGDSTDTRKEDPQDDSES
jgi:segregation and condensation protein B